MGSTTGALATTARIEQHGLIAAECEALTGGRPDEAGVAACTSLSRIERAAYVHAGHLVIARSSSATGLAAEVARRAPSGREAHRFRIDVHDPLSRSTLRSAEVSTLLADAIDAEVDLTHPRHRFVVIVGHESWTFTEVVATADASFRRHDRKPWTTSSSLDSRFARALVNLVPDATSILDPCCGAGSIVIEAASLGLEAVGVDWKPALVGMTTTNLAHFGYEATVVRADAREHEQTADAVVTDLPYGNAIQGDERVIRAILERCAEQAPTGVFVAPTDISIWLTLAGYRDATVHRVTKRRGFTRWIHVATGDDRSVPRTAGESDHRGVSREAPP